MCLTELQQLPSQTIGETLVTLLSTTIPAMTATDAMKSFFSMTLNPFPSRTLHHVEGTNEMYGRLHLVLYSFPERSHLADLEKFTNSRFIVSREASPQNQRT